MARMHSGRKGKSGSTRPDKIDVQSWIRYKPKEVELLVTKMAKDGKSASEIGLHLRDTYGIPSVKAITKKSITEIMKQKKINPKLPENLSCLIRRVIALNKHLENNHKDTAAQRGLILTESKIRRLVKYYQKNNVLPQDWKYSRKQVSLLLD